MKERVPRGEAFAEKMASYLDFEAGGMYQSKESLRPGVSSSESEGGGEGKEVRPERADFAATRWDLEEGTSQSGRVAGTSAYS